ncbi:MAG: hypothetical protein LKJ86_09810 [Oscillibacter sp.]|jgi:hypothetical protein|nr:hypothetical protein [Oscillibacter sp.]
MEKYLLKTTRQLQIGEIVSAVGFGIYIVAAALAAADAVQLIILAVFSLVAVWEMVSMVLMTPEKRQQEVTTSLLWGHSAITIFLVGCLVLTIRQMCY